MSRPKKEKNIDADVTETKDQKFRRLANVRAKKVIYELNRLVNMTSQPGYEILDVDAEKMLNAVASTFNNFSVIYEKISKGQSIKTSKKEQTDIF
jgi:hypothetical protein